jgi:hypothetical protein
VFCLVGYFRYGGLGLNPPGGIICKYLYTYNKFEEYHDPAVIAAKSRHSNRRSPGFLNQWTMRFIEWMRMPGDLVFIGLGVMPAVAAAVITYLKMRTQEPSH